jgi:hypothetical protein
VVVRNNGLTHDDKPDRGFDPLEQFVGALGVHTVRAAHRDMPNALGRNVFPTPTAPVLAVTSLGAAVVSAEVRVYHGALRKARRGAAQGVCAGAVSVNAAPHADTAASSVTEAAQRAVVTRRGFGCERQTASSAAVVCSQSDVSERLAQSPVRLTAFVPDAGRRSRGS